MKLKKLLSFGILFFVLVLLSVNVNAVYTRSQVQGIGSSFGGSFYGNLDDFNNQVCEDGTDFVLQIAPFGCQPSVVRSDLLEEQNVPVFCQIAATKINPLIDVKAIDSLTFAGSYPEEVSGVGFHPARAALGEDKDLNSPVLDNIGYAVIVLKQQSNESAMPEFVEGNLSATIHYDIKNAFGIGKSEFYLPVLSDSEWETRMNQYGFWQGRGFLRLEGLYENSARIGLYDNTEKRIASATIEKGDESRKIYLPGFDCLAGLELRLEDLKHPGETATFEVDGEYFEVAEKEKFLDQRCTLERIESYGLQQRVEINCKEDDVGFTNLIGGDFYLEILPKLDFELKNEEDVDKILDVEIGDKLDYNSAKDESIYLGYARSLGEEAKLEKSFVVLVKSKGDADKLSEEQLELVQGYFEKYLNSQEKSNAQAKNIVIGYFNKKVKDFKTSILSEASGAESVFRDWFKDTTFKAISYSEDYQETWDDFPEIKISGFSGVMDSDLIIDVDKIQESLGCIDYENKKFDASLCSEGDEVRYELSDYEVFIDNWYVKTSNGWNLRDSEEDGVEMTNEEINDIYGRGYATEFNISGEKYTKEELENIASSFGERGVEDNSITNYYSKAETDLKTIVNSFSSVSYPDTDQKLGPIALYRLISLAESTSQKKTLLELCAEFKEKYPDSVYMNDLYQRGKGKCDNVVGLASSSISAKDVYINGEYKTISFRGVNEPEFEDYGVELRIVGSDMNGGLQSLKKGGMLILSEKDTDENGKVVKRQEFITFNEIKNGVAEFDVAVEEEGAKELWRQTKLYLREGESKVIGKNNYRIELENLNLEKMAKVSVIPSIDNSESKANFTFKVGIEKRAIQLSPEQARERITEVNKTIADFQDISDKLETAVEGFNKACLATGTSLTLINMIQNIGTSGKSIARKNVMQDYWTPWCTEQFKEGKYESIEVCYYENNEKIGDSVEEELEIMNKQEEIFNRIENIEGVVQDTSILGLSKDINTAKFKQAYVEEVRKDVEPVLRDIYVGGIAFSGGETVLVSNFVEDYINDTLLGVEELRSLQRNALLYKEADSSVSKERAKKNLDVLVNEIYRTRQAFVEAGKVKESASELGFSSIAVIAGEKAQNLEYGGDSIKGENIKGVDDKFKEDETVYYQIVSFKGDKYFVTLNKKSESNYQTDKVYSFKSKNGEKITITDNVNPESGVYDYLPGTFVRYNADSYNNKFESSLGETEPVLRYYETEPNEGLPALIPFDKDNGWYVSVSNAIAWGKTDRAYDESGRINTFYVCNVGGNNIEENKGGDDICQRIDVSVSQTYTSFAGLSEKESYNLAKDAISAVEQASRARNKNPGLTEVRIKRQSTGKEYKFKVGSPAVEVPDFECTNFMSPKQCQILFNVCDPVVCPSSRCDLGGAYPVKDVAQSGVVGSLLLCLPNLKEGIYVPVCLTGVKAGVEGYLSILKSYQSCLQESIDTGKTVGICDELHSFYTCDFFWKQTFPIAKIGLPKILEAVAGERVRGGGEYSGVQDAWDTTQQSAQTFLTYYQSNSNRIFKARSFEDFLGNSVCKNSISAVYPQGDVLDSLTSANSPVQFHGRFDVIPMTTATNPPMSQYKVFYHIYAGENRGAQYRVYLKADDGGSFYQDVSRIYSVASGYIGVGETASETKDFTAPNGYKELCINVNGQEECGFKEVSTSFALNYVSDKYKEEQAKKVVNSEEECISGSASFYSFLETNPQAIAEAGINPEIASRGLIRVCASESPGKNVDTSDGGENARWADMGYCDKANGIKCWLDKESVKNTIKNLDIEGDTLSEVTNKTLERLKEQGNVMTSSQFSDFIKEVRDTEDPVERIELINSGIDSAFYDTQKAILIFERGNAYADLTRKLLIDILKEKLKVTPSAEPAETPTKEPGAEVVGEKLSQDFVSKTCDIAEGVGISNSGWLFAIMHFETGGSFDPAETNKANSGATGLIQFMPSTYQSLTEEVPKIETINDFKRIAQLAEMSRVEQLDLVEKYFKPYKGKMNSIEDTYMAVLWPSAIGKSNEYVLFERVETSDWEKSPYFMNRGLDLDGNGKITKSEASQKVNEIYESNYRNVDCGKELEIPGSATGSGEGSDGEDESYERPDLPSDVATTFKDMYKLDCKNDAKFKEIEGLCGAIEDKKINKIKSIADANGGLSEMKDSQGRTAVHYAANSFIQTVFTDLTSSNVNLLSQKDNNGNIPLHYAYLNNNDGDILLAYEKKSLGSLTGVKNNLGVSPKNIENWRDKETCEDCGSWCTKEECDFIEINNKGLDCISQEADLIDFITPLVTCVSQKTENEEQKESDEESFIAKEGYQVIMQRYFNDYDNLEEVLKRLAASNGGCTNRDDSFTFAPSRSSEEEDYRNKLSKMQEADSRSDTCAVLTITPSHARDTIDFPIGSYLENGGIYLKGSDSNQLTVLSSVGHNLMGGNIYIENTRIQSALGYKLYRGFIFLGSGSIIENDLGTLMGGGTIIIKSGAEIEGKIGQSMRGGKIIIEEGAKYDKDNLNQDAVRDDLIEIQGADTAQTSDDVRLGRPKLTQEGDNLVVKIEHNCYSVSYDIKKKTWWVDDIVASGVLMDGKKIKTHSNLQSGETYYVTNVRCLTESNRLLKQGEDSEPFRAS